MEFCKFCLNVFGETLRVSECNSQTGVSDAAFCRVTVLWRCNRLSLTLTLKQSTDQSVPKRNQSTDRSVSKHGPKHCLDILICFGKLWTVVWLTLTLTLTVTWTLTLKRNKDRSTDRSTASVPKHGPKHRPCFGPYRSSAINYSMPLNRGHRIAKMRKHRGLANPNPNPNVNPNPKTKHRPKHGPKHCFGTEAWIEAQTMFWSIPK